MSVTPASDVALDGQASAGRWATGSILMAPLGAVGLVLVLGASIWLAVAAAGDAYLLQLPDRGDPTWVAGPLRELFGPLGSLGPSGFSAAMIALIVGYAAALAAAAHVPARAAWGVIVAATLAFTLGPTLVSSDVFGYIAYARLEILHGLNPYLAAPSSAPHDAILPLVYWKHATSPYGPLFTLGSAPLGLLSGAGALWTFKALAGIASLSIAALLARLANGRGLNGARAAIFFALNPVVLTYAVSGAHNDLIAVLLIVCALSLVVAGRDAAGAGTAVGAAAVKITLGLALPFVLIGARRRGRAVAGAGVAMLAVGVVTVGVFGPHVLDQLHRIVTDPQFDTAWSGPDRLASALHTSIGPAIRAAAICCAAAAFVAAVLWALRGGDWITACGWAVFGLILSIASLAPWYLVWILPLAALGRSRRLQVAALLATAYIVAVHLPVLGATPWLSGPAG